MYFVYKENSDPICYLTRCLTVKTTLKTEFQVNFVYLTFHQRNEIVTLSKLESMLHPLTWRGGGGKTITKNIKTHFTFNSTT